MKELIRKFTMGHPKQMTEPVIWYFWKASPSVFRQ